MEDAALLLDVSAEPMREDRGTGVVDNDVGPLEALEYVKFSHVRLCPIVKTRAGRWRCPASAFLVRLFRQQCGSRTVPVGGGDGIRTHCLYIANVALYQLSYTPEEVSTLAQGAAA